MVAHSMCQPGRPSPSAPPGQDGSPWRRARHSGGSRASRFPVPLGVAAPLGEQLEHLVAVQMGDLAEVRLHGRVEVDVVPTLRGLEPVCGAVRLQLLDRLDDERDRLDGADEMVGRDDLQRRHVLGEEGGLLAGQLGPVPAVALRPLEQRVVDVGDVLDVQDLVAGVAQGADEDVERHVGRGVAQVGRVVRRDAADVQRRGALRRDLVRLAAGRVVEAERPTGPRNHGQERRRPRDHGVSLDEGYAHTRPGAPAGFGASRFRERATGWPASRRSDAGGAATAAARSPAGPGLARLRAAAADPARH